MQREEKAMKAYADLKTSVFEVNQFMNDLGAQVFRDLPQLSNPVLSRNPYTSQILRNLNLGLQVKGPGLLRKMAILGRYFFRQCYEWSLFVFVWKLSHFLCRNSWQYSHQKKRIFIHTFILMKQILKQKKFEEKYFPGLSEELLSKGHDVFFLGSLTPEGHNPWRYLKCLKILRTSRPQVILIHDLIGLGDLFKALWFCCLYPFKHFKLLQMARGHQLYASFAADLWNSLDQFNPDGYWHYLAGKKLLKSCSPSVEVVSWFENQVIHKNLYKGMRESCPGVKIWGAKLFIYGPGQMNYDLIAAEVNAGLAPDIVLVTGQGYLETLELKQPEHRVGPAFRYHYLFTTTLKRQFKGEPLILLSYFQQTSIEILERVNASALKNRSCRVRLHPVLNFVKIAPLLQNHWQVSDAALIELLEESDIVITSESGTALEALALGVPVLIIVEFENFTVNPLPALGQGKVWELVCAASDLEIQSERLLSFKRQFEEEFLDICRELKEKYFMQPSRENIRTVFEL